MVNYLPTPDDIEEHIPEILAGNLSIVAEKLNTTQQNLEVLLDRNPEALDMIRTAREELEALLELRVLTLAPIALSALEGVLRGVITGKQAMASVQAAREVLDRNAITAKVSRNASQGRVDGQGTTALPPLEELLDKSSPGDHMAIVDRYMSLMSEVDDFRAGRATVKNVTPGDADEGHTGPVSPLPDEVEAGSSE